MTLSDAYRAALANAGYEIEPAESLESQVLDCCQDYADAHGVELPEDITPNEAADMLLYVRGNVDRQQCMAAINVLNHNA